MMSSFRLKLAILASGLLLSGCMQGTTYEATNTSTFKPHDKELLAKIRYANTPVAEPFRRAIVEYHRKEAPGSIMVDSDNHYLYYVMDGGKAIRYGITVGEEAMAWSGVAKIGAMTEWPAWHPTSGEIERLGVPSYVAPGPDNPWPTPCARASTSPAWRPICCGKRRTSRPRPTPWRRGSRPCRSR